MSEGLTVARLAATAGYRVARLRDVPEVLRLAGRAERAHPGLLGRPSRTLPGAVIRPLVYLAILAWLVAGIMVYNPAGATVAVLPVAGVEHRRRAIVVSTLAATAVVLGAVCITAAALSRVTGFEAELVAIGLSFAIGLPAVGGLPRAREIRAQERKAAAAAGGAPVIEPGAYFGTAPATTALATALLETADRHGIWLLLQTSGEARIRLYARLRFVVIAVPSPITARREPRVFMIREPSGVKPTVGAADPALWRRRAY